MKKYILMFLVFVSVCSGAQYYVDSAADAGGDGTTPALTGANCAFQTIQEGVDQDDATTDISVAAGTYLEAAGAVGIDIGVELSGNTINIIGAGSATTLIDCEEQFIVYIDGGDGTTLNLEGFTLESTDLVTDDTSIIYATSGATNLTISVDSCVLGTESAVGEVSKQRGFDLTCANDGVLTVTNSTVYARGTARGCVYLYGFGSASLEGCTLKSTGTGSYGAVFCLRSSNTKLSISESCSVEAEESNFGFIAGSSIDQIECYDSSFVSNGTVAPISIPSVAPAGTLVCKRFICKGNTVSNGYSGNTYGIVVGNDTALNEPLDLIIIQDNDVIKTNGTGTEHGVLLAPNMIGASVVNNRIKGFGYGLVIKGEGHTVKDNEVIQGTHATSGHCFYLKSAWGCTVENNLLVGNSSGGSVVQVLTQNVVSAIEGYNTVRHNIAIGTNSGGYTLKMSNDYQSNLFDYNLYTDAVTRLADFDDDSDDITTMAELRSWWASVATTEAGKENDINSILRTVSVSYDSDGWPLSVNGLLIGENYGPVSLQNTGSAGSGAMYPRGMYGN